MLGHLPLEEREAIAYQGVGIAHHVAPQGRGSGEVLVDRCERLHHQVGVIPDLPQAPEHVMAIGRSSRRE